MPKVVELVELVRLTLIDCLQGPCTPAVYDLTFTIRWVNADIHIYSHHP